MTGRQLDSGRPRRARRARALLLALVVALLTATAGAVTLLPAAAADSSAQTKKVESGPFAGLEITVAKTANLVNEVVEVTWKGGKPTEPTGGFRRHFLQIMQCWGDDPGGPRREQCQWGAIGAVEGNTSIGYAVRTRQVRLDSLPLDPLETETPSGPINEAYVPFHAADGREVAGQFNKFNVLFDNLGSNELPTVRTRADGTGQEFFEVQTGVEAPGLGCGRLVSQPGEPRVGRSCWLVVVPRSNVEVDGSLRTEEGVVEEQKRVETSPLSASNWAHHIAIPLGFQPIGGSCPLGAGQLTVLGHESATEAISRWQQSLCEATGEVFDFNQVPDDAARTNLAGTRPSLAVVGRPLELPAPKGEVVYAPLNMSGIGFTYNLEAQTVFDDPPEIQQRAGQRIDGLRLTARLVAKLITQSYKNAVNDPENLGNNPARIEDDPEFKALNPQLDGVNRSGSSLFTVITALNPSDATRLVWKWIAGDTDAREFIGGKPDPDGMTVNPAFKDMELERSDFPKLDQVCRPAGPARGELCVPDAFPYSNDMHEAVRAATRGDTLAKTSWSGQSIPPVYKKAERPLPKGQRAIMVVSDSATAARYNLPMAKLRNASGQFVGPDTENLHAAVSGFKESGTRNVLTPDPNVGGEKSYPLTMISYAATIPAALDDKARAAYAGLIEYANGNGQKPGITPGSLPAGYAPLPDALTAAGKAAAQEIRTFARAAAPTPTPVPSPSPAPSENQGGSGGSGTGSGGQNTSSQGSGAGSSGQGSSGSGSSGSGTTGSGGSTSTGSGTTVTTPTPAPDAAATPQAEVPIARGTLPPATPAPAAAPVAAITPALPVGKARLLLLWILIGGCVAAAAARAIPRLPALQEGTAAPTRTGSPPLKPHASWRGLPGSRGR